MTPDYLAFAIEYAQRNGMEQLTIRRGDSGVWNVALTMLHAPAVTRSSSTKTLPQMVFEVIGWSGLPDATAGTLEQLSMVLQEANVAQRRLRRALDFHTEAGIEF